MPTPAKPQEPDASAQDYAQKGLVRNGELVDSMLILGKFSSPNLAWNCIVFAAPHARPFVSVIGHPMQSVDPARTQPGGLVSPKGVVAGCGRETQHVNRRHEEFRKQTDYISIVFIHTERARGRARSSVSTSFYWIMFL